MYAEGVGECNRKYMCAVKGRSSQVRARLTRSGEFYVLHLPYPVYVYLQLLVNKYEGGGSKVWKV